MDNFNVVKRLGDGNQGVAHLCVDKRTNQRVVVKKMPSGLRSAEEINVALRVKHANIIPLVEVFSQDDFVFIVTKFAEGGDLEQFLEKLAAGKKTVPTYIINQWIRQLCRALHHCHQARVMHRDVKPSNIFLSKDATQVFLGDFGVSKMFQGSMDVATTFVGSPIWLAPEVLSGTPYGVMSDVWSLGCVFYEMMTLRKPFAAPHFAALVMRICSGQYDALPSDIAPHLAAVIEGMLNIDANERWLLTDVLNSSEYFSAAPKANNSAGSKEGSASHPKHANEAFNGNNNVGGGSDVDALMSDAQVTSAVDFQVWAEAKLRDVAAIEVYLNKHKVNDLARIQQLPKKGHSDGTQQRPASNNGGAGAGRIGGTPNSLQENGSNSGAYLNRDRAKRMLASPIKAPEAAARQPSSRSPLMPVVEPPPAANEQHRVTPSASPSVDDQPSKPAQRWAEPQGGAKVAGGGGRRASEARDRSPQRPVQAPPQPPPPPKLPREQERVGGVQAPPAQRARPASGQPAMVDIPTPPRKADQREAQRQDIKAMIREQRARAAASGGDVTVEILLPSNLRNLPQNKVM